MNMRVSTDHPELPVRSLTVETTVVEIILAIDPKFLAAKLDASVTFIVGAQCGLKITGSSTGVLPERRRILVTARISYIGPLRWPEFGQQNDRVSSCVSAKPLLIVYWPHSPLGLCFPPGSNEPLSSDPSPSPPMRLAPLALACSVRFLPTLPVQLPFSSRCIPAAPHRVSSCHTRCHSHHLPRIHRR